MTHPTDEELDALVQDLRPMNGCNEFDRAVEAIMSLRAQLAEARAELTFVTENRNKWQGAATQRWFRIEEANARADRAEAERSAQIEVEPVAWRWESCANSQGWNTRYGCEKPTPSDYITDIVPLYATQPHDRTALDRMLADAKAEALQGPWSDEPDALTDAVHKAHPVFTQKYDTYTQSLELVSNRHSKGALVALVNYLLRQSDEAREKALREAAGVAANACLVEPDGGNPTEDERLVCEEASRRIAALLDKEGA